MDYADSFLRGLCSEDWIRDGLVTTAAFQFDTEHIKDNWMQQSICWEDNESVVELMLKQKKKNDETKYQFKAGVAKLPRESIKAINRVPTILGLVSYERDPLPENPFHGNLLVDINVSKTQKYFISVHLASHVIGYIDEHGNYIKLVSED